MDMGLSPYMYMAIRATSCGHRRPHRDTSPARAASCPSPSLRESLCPGGLDPPSSVPLDGRGENPLGGLANGSDVFLGQAAGRLKGEAGLLLDQEEPAGRPDDGEVDLAEDRVAPAHDLRPVRAVIDGVIVGWPGGSRRNCIAAR
jgi:hypothetical protein